METKRNKQYVTDLIGDDYKGWQNESVILNCGTGAGKTYFCIHVLGSYAKANNKKVLYLCNRTKLHKQVYDEVKRCELLGTVIVQNYQTIEKMISKGKHQEIPHYDYIIADESHYFYTDSKQNKFSDVSHDFLMNQSDNVIIWCSATANVFFEWLAKYKHIPDTNIYAIAKDYSYVRNVYFYGRDELTVIIDDILEEEPNSKIVVFLNSSSRMITLSDIYKDKANYFCSNSSENQRLKEICGWTEDTERIKDCVYEDEYGNITFPKRILFTTSVLDNGVDLKDANIKHIITELVDIDSMVQSLGRKRPLNTDDTCTFYIRKYDKRGVRYFQDENWKHLEPANLYVNDYDAFYKQYGDGKRDELKDNPIFYTEFLTNGSCVTKINKL